MGWAIAFGWFALSTVETIRPDIPPYDPAVLPIAIVLIPALFPLIFRPRAGSTERFAPALALLVALAGLAPLFEVLPR